MTLIIYKKLSKKFPAQKLKEFFNKALPGKTIKQCKNILKRSSFIIGAFDENNLIGIGRALDDTVYAFITDIIINPSYQKQGIGSAIVNKLCDQLIKKDVKIIHCSTDKKLIPFYKKAAGFKYNSKDVTLYFKNFD